MEATIEDFRYAERNEVGARFDRTVPIGCQEGMASKHGNSPGGWVYCVRSGGAGVLRFRPCADGRGFPPRGCVVGVRSRCTAVVRQPIALRSLRLCGNDLGVPFELCGYPRGLQLCATIRQFLRELRRIPGSAHRAFGGRLPPASPAAM